MYIYLSTENSIYKGNSKRMTSEPNIYRVIYE